MACFQSSLIAEKVREADSLGRADWMLREPLIFQSDLIGLLIVPSGFICDFASVPRLPVAFWLTGDTAHASAVVHDYLCRVSIPNGDVTWRQAADVFDEAMKAEGVSSWRRFLMRWAVTGADPANKWEDPQ